MINKVQQVSGLPKRLLAYSIDCIILMIPVSFLGMIFTVPYHSLNLLNMLSHCTYFTYFLSSTKQASLGQQLLNIHTIYCYESARISLQLAFDRTISQFFLPIIILILTTILNYYVNPDDISSPILFFIFFLISLSSIVLLILWYLIALFSHNNQTFHDKIFNTMVVIGKFKQ